MIVVDTSVSAYFFIRGERTVGAERAMQKDPDWIVPRLWRSELRNVLATHLRVQSISLETAIEAITKAESLFRNREYEVSSIVVLGLSLRSRASAYDCEFVALAQQIGIPLLTADRRLAAAFPETAISLDEWLAT